jgi:hypothetical protein
MDRQENRIHGSSTVKRRDRGSSPLHKGSENMKYIHYMQTHYLPDRKSRGKLQETEGSNPWDW